MNDINIGVSWTELIPIAAYLGLVLIGLGVYLLLDIIFMVGFLDGPKASTCFKLMLGWMAGSAMGLITFSLLRDTSWMFIFSISTIACFSTIRLVTWLKGLYLGPFLTGESIKIKE